jgi:hypothetical protein
MISSVVVRKSLNVERAKKPARLPVVLTRDGKPMGEPMRHEGIVNVASLVQTGATLSLPLATRPRACGTPKAASRWASQCAMRA